MLDIEPVSETDEVPFPETETPLVDSTDNSPAGTLKETLKFVAFPASISATESALSFASEKTTGSSLVVSKAGP